jgi:hypothetical protein
MNCLRIALLPQPLFSIGGAVGLEPGLVKVPASECIGSLDVLRNGSGEAVGVRLWPFDEAAAILEGVPLSGHIVTSRAGWEWSFLFKQEAWEESCSVDQILCDGEIFVDGEDHVILKIDGGIFPEGRVAALRRGLGA